MRKIRSLHLWIGLFTSLLILIEAVTGLLMLEPALMGAGRPQGEQRVMINEPAAGQVSDMPPTDQSQAGQQATTDQSNSGQATGRPAPGQQQSGQQNTTDQTNTGQVQGRRGPGGTGTGADGKLNPTGQGTSFAAFVKGLHSGRIGGTDISILLDIVAISLIFMTVTGMILTVKALKRQRA